MAVAIVLTPEGSRNSFLAVADATTIIDGIYGADARLWDSASTDDRARLLRTATADISAGKWIGYPQAGDQAQAWPRDSQEDDGIPTEVQRATVRQALFLLSGRSRDAQFQADGGRSIAIAGASTSFAGRVNLLCEEAMRELRDWKIAGAAVA